MHSRIFQISKETIDVSDYIEASDIPEGFQSGIADYVVDVEDRTAELKCLMESFTGIFVPESGKDSFRIAPNGKKAYFNGGYKRFRELCALMLTTTMEAFIGMEAGPEDRLMSREQFSVDSRCVESLFKQISTHFAENKLIGMATDVPIWNLELFNTTGEVFRYTGPMLRKSHPFLDDISDELRLRLNQVHLFAFDGEQ